jgi:biopolymer transport protein ExbD
MRRYRYSHSAASEEEINITPMIDVVFIMLIFFIVTSSFVKESGIDVNRPSAVTAVRKERGNIIIAINADDEVWMDKRPVDIRAVRANIERLRASAPNGTVVILSDKKASTGTLVKVMDQIGLAGITAISIAANTEGG